MITIICVLKSGGIYGPDDVAKLQANLAKIPNCQNLVCLSDVDVPCKRIAMQHDWQGWWSKIELFRPGVVGPNTIYIDLDSVVLDDFSEIAECGHDFAMMQNLKRPHMVSSALMWFYHKAPVEVYKKFVVNPIYWVKYHQDNKDGPYLGDQAFIWDALDRNVPVLETKKYGICHYRLHVKDRGKPPDGCKIVDFGGQYKPNNVDAEWLRAIRG